MLTILENKNFMITPDAHWFAICGMYKQHVDNYANTLTLHHLKNYNMKWDSNSTRSYEGDLRITWRSVFKF